MYKIADFNVEIKTLYTKYAENAKEFLTLDTKPDFIISCSEKEISCEDNFDNIANKRGYLEFVATQRKLAELLPLHNAFILHSASFDVDGIGIAFAALSGTGKTTHMRLWQKLLGDKMVVVNGDKPIVRFFDDEPETPYAYGTPWNGKERLGCNMRTPLKHICFIERSKTNFVEPVEKQNVINLIFNQLYMPKDPIAVMNTMQLIDRLLSCCNFWKIHCNMEIEAAEIAYETIFNAKCKMQNAK